MNASFIMNALLVLGVLLGLICAVVILRSVRTGIALYRASALLPIQHRATSKLLSWNLLEPGITSLCVVFLFSINSPITDGLYNDGILSRVWHASLMLWPMVILLLPGLLRPFLKHRSPYLMPAFYLGLARISVTLLTCLLVVPVMIGIPLLIYSINQINRWHHHLALSVGEEGIMIVQQSTLTEPININMKH